MHRPGPSLRSPDRTRHWTLDEWFVVALARTVRDGEVVFPDVTVEDVARHVTPGNGIGCAC